LTIAIVTVAAAELAEPSFATKVKLSVPEAPISAL
jgi:hypothetical protein